MDETENQQLQVFVCFGHWFANIVDLSCVCMKNNSPDDTPMFDLEDCLNKNENGNLNIHNIFIIFLPTGVKKKFFSINGYRISTFSRKFAHFMFILQFMSFRCCLTLHKVWTTFFYNSRSIYATGIKFCPSKPNLVANILKLK